MSHHLLDNPYAPQTNNIRLEIKKQDEMYKTITHIIFLGAKNAKDEALITDQ